MTSFGESYSKLDPSPYYSNFMTINGKFIGKNWILSSRGD
jgi:hypothetical protein